MPIPTAPSPMPLRAADALPPVALRRRAWPIPAGVLLGVVIVSSILGWGYAALGLSIVIALFLPSRFVYGLGVVWLMSPVSRNGNTTQSSVAVLAFIVCLAVTLQRERALSRRPMLPTAVNRAQLVLLIVILCYALIGLLARHSIRLILWDVQPFLEFAAFAILGSFVLRSEDDVANVFWIVALGAIAKAGLDLYIFFGAFKSGHGADLNYYIQDRIFDAAPVLVLPIILFVALQSDIPRWRDAVIKRGPLLSTLLLFGGAAIIGASLALSFTRTFWLGLALGVPIAAALARGRILRRIVVAGAVITILVAGAAIAQPQGVVGRWITLSEQRIQYTVTQIQAPSNSFHARRQDEITSAYPAIVQSHFLGRGAGASIPLSIPTVFAQEQLTGIVPYLHNYYVQAALNFGVPGLAALAWLTFVVATNLVRRVTQATGFEQALVAGILAAWVIEAVQLATLSTPVMFHTAALMGALTALGLGRQAIGASKAPEISA